MVITNGFNHVATLTTDLDRFQAWYQEVFDAETVFEMAAEGEHPRMAIIDLGGGGALNAFEVPAESMIGDQRRIGARGNIDHFGISVPDRATLEQVQGRLTAAGADIGEIQQLGDCWSLFFRDVDGMELEVCAPLD
ncbi:VOC family protein [Aquihabitans daechungensis]|uniref:VOC family protein n=1 Tax=Aquihabitans daechungensis TaxID=1052257 RepID=UPI003BA2A1AB